MAATVPQTRPSDLALAANRPPGAAKTDQKMVNRQRKYILLKGSHRQLDSKGEAETFKAGDRFDSTDDLVKMFGREKFRLADDREQTERVVERKVFVTENSVEKMSLADLKDFADAEEIALPEDCLGDQKKAAAFLKNKLRLDASQPAAARGG